MTEPNEKRFCFIDLETTGLSPHWHDIIQIGMIVTDQELKEIASVEYCIATSQQDLDKMNAYVKEMHTKNGLIKKVLDTNSLGILPISEAEDLCIKFIIKHMPDIAKNPVVAHGNSVHFDKRFLETKMPALNKLFHHRIVDISSFNECLKVYKPEYTYQREPAHTSLEDCRQSIQEYRNYLEHLSLLKTEVIVV